MQLSRVRFTPVPIKARHDGWTPVRQRHFIQTLAATKSITKACAAVGMTRMSVYTLRGRPDAAEFRNAWRRALEPEFAVEPRRSQRMRQSVRTRREVDNVEEVEGSPNSSVSAPSFSSALKTLETYLAVLRAQDQELGSARGE